MRALDHFNYIVVNLSIFFVQSLNSHVQSRTYKVRSSADCRKLKSFVAASARAAARTCLCDRSASLEYLRHHGEDLEAELPFASGALGGTNPCSHLHFTRRAGCPIVVVGLEILSTGRGLPPDGAARESKSLVVRTRVKVIRRVHIPVITAQKETFFKKES